MPDAFTDKKLKPMLIGGRCGPFSDPDYFFEIKFDGERCLAYLDEKNTVLINKRGVKMLPKVPELSVLNKFIKKRCILDGELMVMKNGKPDFTEIQKRSLMANPLRIKIASERFPACFTAFDILYIGNKLVTNLPLFKRRELLQDNIIEQNRLFALSECFAGDGEKLYDFAASAELEGVVAKHRDSLYYPGKRTGEWLKIKYMLDDDFIILGYLNNDDKASSVSLILGQLDPHGNIVGNIVYCGHVTLGKRTAAMNEVKKLKKINKPRLKMPAGHDNAVFVEPSLVCTVEYMMRLSNGGMRQPIFKGLRPDKTPEECIIGG